MSKTKVLKKASTSINLEREINKKLYSSNTRKIINRNERDPITQFGISDKETELPSDSKPRGPAKGVFSLKGQGSFNFEKKVDVLCSPSTKRSEFVPPDRNPITQDHPSLEPTVKKRSDDKYSKVRDSTVFSSDFGTCSNKARQGQ